MRCALVLTGDSKARLQAARRELAQRPKRTIRRANNLETAVAPKLPVKRNADYFRPLDKIVCRPIVHVHEVERGRREIMSHLEIR